VSPDPLKIIDMIKAQTDAAFSHVHHTSTEYVFTCKRRRKDGVSQAVDVRVAYEGGRYFCEAQAEGGKATAGNSSERADYALSFVHWRDLDEPPGS